WPARRPDLFVLTEPVFYGRFPQGGVRRMERVFITGASSGIGAALALLYARRGASVALVGRRLDALEAVAAGLPGQHTLYPLDVRDRDALHAAAREFLRGGKVAVVIAAAVVSVGQLTECTEGSELLRTS